MGYSELPRTRQRPRTNIGRLRLPGGGCKYGLVPELKTASGTTYSRQLTMADLGAISDRTYSEIRGVPHAYRIGGTNVSLANYFGDLLALAVLPAEELEAFAADYVNAVC